MPTTNLEKKSFIWLLLALLALGIFVISPFLKILLLSVILGVLFYPLQEKLLLWTKGRRNLASVLSVFAVVVLLIVPFAVVLALVTVQAANVLPYFFDYASGSGVSVLAQKWQAYISPWVGSLEQFLGTEINVLDWMRTALQNLAQFLAQYSPNVLLKTANFFFQLFIMVIILFYIFRDGQVFFEKMVRLSPVKDQYERRLAKEIQSTIYGVFYGSFLTGLVQSALAALGFYIAGIPGVLVWGVITFFLSFIPLIGTAGVIIPWVIILLVKGETGHAIFLGIYGGIVIGSSDNLLKPFLIRSNVHQSLIFLSLFGGMAVFGALGLLLGPIIMAMLVAVMKIYERDYVYRQDALVDLESGTLPPV